MVRAAIDCDAAIKTAGEKRKSLRGPAGPCGTDCGGGVIGHNRIDWANRIGFPAYWIAPGSQGQGIMTACCRAVIDHAFRELKVSRVIVAVATSNLRAQKIPERLGFTKISTLKKAEWLYDHHVDHYIYSLAAPKL